jgi:hypothetical protein
VQIHVQIKSQNKVHYRALVIGGEGEIRTREGRPFPLPVFKTGAFNRSAISPNLSKSINYRAYLTAIAKYEGLLKRDADSAIGANNLASLDRARALTERFASSRNAAFLDTLGLGALQAR